MVRAIRALVVARLAFTLARGVLERVCGALLAASGSKASLELTRAAARALLCIITHSLELASLASLTRAGDVAAAARVEMTLVAVVVTRIAGGRLQLGLELTAWAVLAPCLAGRLVVLTRRAISTLMRACHVLLGSCLTPHALARVATTTVCMLLFLGAVIVTRLAVVLTLCWLVLAIAPRCIGAGASLAVHRATRVGERTCRTM